MSRDSEAALRDTALEVTASEVTALEVTTSEDMISEATVDLGDTTNLDAVTLTIIYRAKTFL
jgi:hypothetical protein